MNRLIKYLKIIIPIIVLIMLFGLSYYYSNNQENNKDKVIQKKKLEKKEVKSEKEYKEEVYFYVDIKGAVNNPNVYKVLENSRVLDVINQAGGLKEDADTSIINMSKKVSDEMVIIIYTKEFIENIKKQKEVSTREIEDQINKKTSVIDKNNNAEIKKEEDTLDKDNLNGLVNINTATKEELLTLNGIGESKALAIINYRSESGNFTAIEDIKNVSGIGDSLYEKIKEYITV